MHVPALCPGLGCFPVPGVGQHVGWFFIRVDPALVMQVLHSSGEMLSHCLCGLRPSSRRCRELSRLP